MERKTFGRVILPILVILLSSILILFLWRLTILLTILLMAIAYIKHLICPIKSEFLWFILVSMGGLMIEIILVNFGGVWSYIVGQIFRIPIWMSVFWGLVGTMTITLYKNLFD